MLFGILISFLKKDINFKTTYFRTKYFFSIISLAKQILHLDFCTFQAEISIICISDGQARLRLNLLRYLGPKYVLTNYNYKVWGPKKGHKIILKFLFSTTLRKYLIILSAFYPIMWLIKSPKNFDKIAILKIFTNIASIMVIVLTNCSPLQMIF